MAGHKPVGLIDVYAATIPTLKFVRASMSITPKQFCR